MQERTIKCNFPTSKMLKNVQKKNLLMILYRVRVVSIYRLISPLKKNFEIRSLFKNLKTVNKIVG